MKPGEGVPSKVGTAARRGGPRKGPTPVSPPAPSGWARRTWFAPLVILAVALAARLVILLQLGSHPLLQPTGVLDDAISVQLGNRVAAGDLALGPDVYFLSPFYTYFLGLVFALTGGSMASARVLQIVLGTVSVALIMATTTRWFGRRAGLIAGGLAAFTGLFAFNEMLILQSSIDVFLTSLALYAWTRAVCAGGLAAFTSAGVAFGALALNRPNALPCIGVVVAAWLAARRTTTAARQAALFVLGVSLLVAPVALRNRIVAGEWVLITSHGGLNFYIGNHEGADGTWRSVEGISPAIAGQTQDARRVASRALGHPASASEASDYFYHRAWEWILGNPGTWARLTARKLALTLNAVDVALNYSYTYFSRDETTLLSALVVGPWLLIPLGLFGLAVTLPRADWPSYLTWVLFLPVYALSVAAFFVSSRYRLPLLVPCVAGTGAAGAWLWERRSSVFSRRAAAPAITLVVLFAFVNWPMQADDGRMYERGERIVRFMDEGRTDEGARLLASTEAHYPEPGLLLFRIGLVFRQRGDAPQAIPYLERAMKADPGEPRIRLNLGEALIEAGRPSDAIPHLEAARLARIDQATTAYDLTGAYHAIGRDDLARAALASIEITPGMDGDGLQELGRSALDLQDAALAERFLRVAVARTPALATADFYLAVALAAQGRYGEARQHAELALRAKPDLTDARDLLARLPAK